MSGGAHIPEMESIAAHAEFVRALARSLLLDPNRADDVAQQALLAAMQRDSGGIRRPRAWLATVTRNLVRRSFRSDRRRSRREEGAARPEGEPSAAELAARLETTERLVRAVRGLREPFRETVMLRYFEGRTPDEIAKRKGIPASTVRGRLSRALAMLREELDREHGDDRRAWSLTLLPLALPRGSPGTVTATTGGTIAAVTGGLAVSGKKIAALAAVMIALSIGGALLVSEATAPSGPVPESPPSDTPPEEIAAAEPADTGDPVAAAAEPSDPGSEDWPVRVKTNVPGAEVTIVATYYGGEPDHAPLVKTADADGFAGFALPEREDPLHNLVAHGTATGFGPALAKVENGLAVLTLVPGRPLSGRVEDADGNPVPRTMVFASISRDHTSIDHTDPDGRFTLHLSDGLRDGEGVERWSVNARHPSYLEPESVRAELGDEVRFVLRRGRTVSGRVVDHRGRPVPGIWVLPGGVGADTTRTGPDGSFLLGAVDEKTTYVKVGFQVNRMSGHPGGGLWTVVRLTGDQGVLHDAGEIHVVRVRVRDEEGRPFRHASLTARDVPQGSWGNPVFGDSGTEGEATFSAGGVRKVRVTAVAPGRMPATAEVVFGEDEVVAEAELVLRKTKRPGALAIAIRTADGATPAQVFLTLVRGDVVFPDFSERRVDLDAGGRARVDGIPPGKYRACVGGTKSPSTEGYLIGVGRDVQVESGAETALGLSLRTGGRVRVTVVNRRGDVVTPPWDITLRNEKDWLLAGHLAHLSPGGSFGSPTTPMPVETMGPVEPGRAFVVIEAGEKRLARHEIEILPGRKIEVTVPIDR